jgi:predicted ATP-binding protein involved in virulence
MRLQKLHIQNFRGFQEIILNFPHDGAAVLIGVNGAGKSSILDIIAIMLSDFIAILCRNSKPEVELTENDININSDSTINTITVMTLVGEHLSWQISHARTQEEPTFSTLELRKYIASLQDNLRNQPNLNLPLMVYYQTHRMVLKNPYHLNRRLRSGKKKVHYQFTAYDNAFSTGVNDFQDFFDWFREEEDYENEIRLRENGKYRNPKLEVIRKAIKDFLGGFSEESFSNLRVVRSTVERDFSWGSATSKPTLMITKNHEDFKLEQLSDGEKMLLMLITDLARRLAIANPSSSDALTGEGIVLIDEIDLHLHPQWQRGVIRSLRKTFPNCQFVVTTHSPQVLSSVNRENVFIIENSRIVETTPHTYGKDSNSILYELMNVKERPYEVEKQINHCFQLIDDGHLEAAKLALRELSNLLGENDNQVVRATTLIGFLES